MAIPYEAWPSLLRKIKRILKPGGRLEIIDDQLFYPECQYPYDPNDDKCPPPKVCPRPSKKSNPIRVDGNQSSGSSEYHSATSQPSTLTHDGDDEDDDVFFGGRSASPLPPPPPPKTGPFWEFETRARASRNIERIFHAMIRDKYRIGYQPHTFLRLLLKDIFGEGNSKRSHSYQVVVPTEDMELDVPSTETTQNSKAQKTGEGDNNKRSLRSRGKPITVEWERKDKGKGKAKDTTEKGKEQPAKKPQPRLPLVAPSPDRPGPSSRPAINSQTRFPVPPLPQQMSPKAARVLGENANRPRPTRPYQPAGIIVLPSTFIPCEPDVLEMHAFKNSHLLLASKFAMVRYVDQHRNAEGVPLLSPEDMDELMWDYDRYVLCKSKCAELLTSYRSLSHSFRRRRLNWPQDYPSADFQEECAADGKKSKLFGLLGTHKDKESKEVKEPTALERRRARGHSVSLPKAQQLLRPIKRAGRDNNVIVRTIRVYEAIKPLPTLQRAVSQPAISSKTKVNLKAKAKAKASPASDSPPKK